MLMLIGYEIHPENRNTVSTYVSPFCQIIRPAWVCIDGRRNMSVSVSVKQLAQLSHEIHEIHEIHETFDNPKQ